VGNATHEGVSHGGSISKACSRIGNPLFPGLGKEGTIDAKGEIAAKEKRKSEGTGKKKSGERK